MTITEILILPVSSGRSRLLAYVTVKFDGEFIVHDLKVIQGNEGPFVAMPSKKITDYCPTCRHITDIDDKFCRNCGIKLADNRYTLTLTGKKRIYRDIAHPITTPCREELNRQILEAYVASLQPDKAHSPCQTDFTAVLTTV